MTSTHGGPIDPEPGSPKGPADSSSPAEDPTVTFAPSGSAPVSRSAPGPRNASFRFAPGQILGPYRIERPLGRGGVGEVYEAEHLEAGHRVALKILSSEAHWSETQRQRFLREGMLAASISHPNSLYVYGTEEIDGIPLITMEIASAGTLKEHVERHGAMKPQEAVDAILQVIEGLEAAQAIGILHRDVKPGNCFLDRRGGVKIGDFGLAIAQVARDAAPRAGDAPHLTAADSFLGTPAFASPEQLRGDELDVRSDLYSVGATLYYLLTGAAPFAGATGMKLFAAILEQTPRSPRELRREIPPGLAQTVLRCLNKDPAERLEGYPALRQALQPFSTRGLTPPRPALRFAAGVIDKFFGAIVGSAATAPWLAGAPRPSTAFELLALGLLLAIAYGAIFDGRWGGTPGKLLLGIRVVGPRNTRPGIQRAALRSALFAGVTLPLQVLAVLLYNPIGPDAPTGNMVASGLINTVGDACVLLLFVSARRSNGWMALHDRWSATRLVWRPWEENASMRRAEAPALPPSGASHALGPYLVASGIHREPGQVVAGVDPKLRRAVWIHIRSPQDPPLPEARRLLDRRGRLRWIHSRRAEGEAWDAYEDLGGMPFAAAIASPQPWERVRAWLLTVAEEIEHDPTLPLRMDRIWIGSHGHAAILEFPPPGARGSSQPGEAPAPFLSHLAQAALAGTAARQATGVPGALRGGLAAAGAPAASLPLHGLEFLRKLETVPQTPATTLASELRSFSRLGVRISRRRRLLHAAIAGSIPLTVVILAILGVVASNALDNTLRARNPDLFLLRQGLRRVIAIEEKKEKATVEESREREALEVLVAGPLRQAGAESVSTISWGAPLTHLQRRHYRSIVRQRPAPAPEEVQQSRQVLARFLEETSHRPSVLAVTIKDARVILMFVNLALWFLAPVAVLLGALFRGGVLYRGMGMALVDRNGRAAGRWRCLVRSLVTWSPYLIAWCLLLFMGGGSPLGALDSDHPVSVFLWGALAVFGAGLVALLVFWPARPLQDRVAGTTLAAR